MTFASDLRILYRLALSPIRGLSHQERLESFYRNQAKDYDQFRERLLHGRKELFESIAVPRGGHWIDIGGGTGRNVEFLGERIRDLEKFTIVDLSPSLLEEAQKRVARNDWRNVQLIQADATNLALNQADVVTFSYSLTMIPDWYLAIEQAVKMLRGGGTLGVVDFYVSRKHVEQPGRRHGWCTRHFWPMWFASDNVFLNPDHLPYLRCRTAQVSLVESDGAIPFIPGARVPYYQYVGKKAS